jgi:hypothetical protein
LLTGFIHCGDLQLQQITITENILTLALVATHFDDTLRALTSEANRRRLTPKADGRGLTSEAYGRGLTSKID